MAQPGAVSPKKGLSYSEANDNRKDKPDLERPGREEGELFDIGTDTRDDSHHCEHEKDADTGEDDLHNTTWDVVCKNKRKRPGTLRVTPRLCGLQHRYVTLFRRRHNTSIELVCESNLGTA